MNIDKFSETLVNELRKELGESTTIIVNPVMRNNNNVLLGLHICDGKNKIAPVIYLEELYDRFKAGDLTMKEIAKKIIEINDTPTDVQKCFMLEEFLSWEKAKKNIEMRLINQSMNEKLLEDVPWIPQQDLAVVFCYCKYDVDNSAAYSIFLHNHHKAEWNVTVKELLEAALQNFSCNDVVILSITDLLGELGEEFKIPMPEIDESDINMYVLTNKRRQYGATAIVHTEILQEFSAKHGNKDILILPSSIHEQILIPLNGDEDMSQYREMIQDVNSTQLSTDILSDHAYIYRKEDNEIQSVL